MNLNRESESGGCSFLAGDCRIFGSQHSRLFGFCSKWPNIHLEGKLETLLKDLTYGPSKLIIGVDDSFKVLVSVKLSQNIFLKFVGIAKCLSLDSLI